MSYDRVNWQNQPSTATPINADNLNKMDSGIKALEEGKIAKTDLVQTDTINDPNKVPSSAVTHALGQEIGTLNNNLAWEDERLAVLQNGWTGAISYQKNNIGIVTLRLSITPGSTAALTILTQLPVGYRPFNNINIQLTNARGNQGDYHFYLNANGNLYVNGNANFPDDELSYSGQYLYKANNL